MALRGQRDDEGLRTRRRKGRWAIRNPVAYGVGEHAVGHTPISLRGRETWGSAVARYTFRNRIVRVNWSTVLIQERVL